MPFKSNLNKLLSQAKREIESATADNFDDIKTKYLGRKSELSEILSRIKELPDTQKIEMGKLGNAVKTEVAKLIATAETKVSSSTPTKNFDPTTPGTRLNIGRLHPISEMVRELVALFRSLGFSVADGPEVELEEYNFNLLNIPADHPARDEWDTFWINRKEARPNDRLDGRGGADNSLLRTHTSPVQLRYMLDNRPPIRVIAPGRTFRFEAEDATHSSVFNQLECLMVDKNITVGHLKGVLELVFKKILGDDIELRLRPSFFPFTEPSFEVDVKFRGAWLELGGAGMVHPTVLLNANIDPNTYSGFAFGLGIDRLVMLKHDIKDVRLLLSANLDFLKQF